MNTKDFIAAALLALSFVACGKDGNDGTDDNNKKEESNVLTAPVLSVNKSSLALEGVAENVAAIKFEWTAASLDAPVSYDLYANVSSRDIFTSPGKVTVGSALSVELSQKQVNDILTALEITEETEFQFAVYAMSDGLESVLSNTVKVKLTPYEKPFPDAIYLIGSATGYGWDASGGLRVPSVQKNVYKVSDVPLRVVPANTGVFKFALSNDGSDGRFVGQAPGGAFGDIVVVNTGMGYEFFPGQNGYENGAYDLTVDLNTMKLTMNRTGDLPAEELPDHLYMCGGCFEWSWTFTGTTLDRVSDNKYKAEGVKMTFGTDSNPLGFKVFTGVDKWWPYYAMGDDATKDKVTIRILEKEAPGDPQFYPGKLGYVNGTYTVEMDFDAMVAKFTLTEEASPFPEKLYLLGGCFGVSNDDFDWKYNDKLVLESVESGVYVISDLTFTGMEEWNGFKIYSGLNWAGPWYGMDLDNSTADNIILVDGEKYIADTEATDTQVYLGRFGYEAGEYSIRVDLNKMTLTATAK